MSWPEVVTTLITTLGTVLSAWFANSARSHATVARQSAGDAQASAERATSQYPIDIADAGEEEG